jgi:hypothetical protein
MSSIPYNYGSYIDAKVAMTDTGHVSAGKQIQSPASAGSRGLAKTTQFTNDRTQMQMGNSPIAESMIEIRSILNRIDGVNAPVQEDDMQDMTISDLEAQLGKINDEITFLKIDEKDKESALAALGELRSVLDKYQSQKESAVQEDLDYRSEDILNKAGFDPADIDTYMKVFNDHGDTSDIDQMNMKEKVGLAEVMSIVLASHGIQNESYQPFPEGDEFDIEEDEDFEEVLGPLGFPEDETELFDAEYQGRKVPLNKPMRGDTKKFKVYVKDPKTGNVKKVNFGHGGTSAKRKTMRIRKSNPKARKSFRARHNCANPGPKTKARYWSCRKW